MHSHPGMARGGTQGRWGGAAIVALAAAGCASYAQVPEAPETLVCPELSGSADPLLVSYSSDPADGRIRAFVSSVRGLYDVTLEMERLAEGAPRRIGHDLGAPPPPAGATLDELCRPLEDALATIERRGIAVRISVAPPRCEGDAERGQRCAAWCADPSCTTLCSAETALYARCSLPAVTAAATSDGVDVVALGRTLEQNLPSLLYAEMALGKRLLENVRDIVAAAGHLPDDVKAAGPRGAACVALAAAQATKSAQRLDAIVSTSERATAALHPEIRPPGEVAP